MTYLFRNNQTTYHGIPASVVGQELEYIREKTGYLKTEDVVAEAANLNNPLHPVFVWDDALAGHSYRLMQARQLIRVVYIENDGPAYYNLPVTVEIDDEEVTERVYQSAQVLVRRPAELEAALAYLLESKLNMAIRACNEVKRLIRQRAASKKMATVSSHLAAAKEAASQITLRN